MNPLVRLCLALVMLLLGLAAAGAQTELPLYGDYYLHDPGTLIKDDSLYYIYGDGQGISGLSTSDLRNWNATSPVFTATGYPGWITNAVPGFTGYFWAPDIAYFNGRYNLYYAASIFGGINSVIGLVTTPSLISPAWTDQGKVIQSNPVGETTTNTDLTAYNCIDPCVMVDTNGTVWLSFGSYSDGILVMQLNPATGLRLATNSPIYRVSNNGPVFFSNTEEGSYIYQHGGWYYLFVNFGGCCDGVDSTYNIRMGRATAVTGPYFDRTGINMTNGGGTMMLESSARFIGPGHAAIMNDNGTNWFTCHYYDGNNNGTPTLGLNRIYWTTNGWPALTNDWSAFYPFNTDAREHLGLYNGTLMNGASITNEPARGNMLSLNGTTQYAQLANPVANASTFSAWVKWCGGAAWQRIFDFGTGTTNYLFLTPESASGTMRFAITTNGNGAEQQINAPAALPTNSWCHVAVTLDGQTGLLYLDGQPVATNTSLTIRPWQLLATSNYVGKSQFTGDPGFNGRIESLRIYSRALSAAEITNIAEAPPGLAHRYSFSTNAPTPVWDSIGMAHGELEGSAVVTNNALVLNGTAGYASLPGGLVSGCASVTLEFWATFGANAAWARVFDFGTNSGANGVQYLFYTPHDATGGQELQISTNITATLAGGGVLDNQTVCVACIVDPTNNYMAVYTNGVLEAAQSGSTPLLRGVSKAWSYLGHSLFTADPWTDASIDEFRIYDGRLTPQQIATDYQFGPNALALPVTLVQSNTPAGLTLSWPSWAVGFTPQSTVNLTAGWTPLPQTQTLAADQWSLFQAKTNTVRFYRLQR